MVTLRSISLKRQQTASVSSVGKFTNPSILPGSGYRFSGFLIYCSTCLFMPQEKLRVSGRVQLKNIHVSISHFLLLYNSWVSMSISTAFSLLPSPIPSLSHLYPSPPCSSPSLSLLLPPLYRSSPRNLTLFSLYSLHVPRPPFPSLPSR